MDKTNDGQLFRALNSIDEYSRESLAIQVKRNHKSEEILECLTEVFCAKETLLYAVRYWIGVLRKTRSEMVA